MTLYCVFFSSVLCALVCAYALRCAAIYSCSALRDHPNLHRPWDGDILLG